MSEIQALQESDSLLESTPIQGSSEIKFNLRDIGGVVLRGNTTAVITLRDEWDISSVEIEILLEMIEEEIGKKAKKALEYYALMHIFRSWGFRERELFYSLQLSLLEEDIRLFYGEGFEVEIDHRGIYLSVEGDPVPREIPLTEWSWEWKGWTYRRVYDL